MQIGIAGLGRMGAAMAARLMEVGHTLAVWNRTPAKAKPLIDAGAKLAASPEDLTEHSDVIITVLTDADAIDHVYNGEHGLLSGDVNEKLFIEMSTVRPEIPIALAKVVRASGAPSSNVRSAAQRVRRGRASCSASWARRRATRSLRKPILDQLCRRLEHVGAVGNGALAKFTINMPLMIYYQALGEALSMARPIGLEPERLMDIIADSSGGPNMLKTRGPIVANMLKGEYPPVMFDLDGCMKDLALMQAEGKARGLTLPLVQMTLACMEESASKGVGTKEAAAHSVYWSKK